MDRVQSERLGSAFNHSVYLMLLAPAALIGGLIAIITVTVRSRAKLDAGGAPVAAPPTDGQP